MRILIALLLTLAGLVAATPTASAVAICSTQADATDLVVGDDPIVKETCTTENLISYDCDVVITVNQDGSVTRTTRCDCLVCPGPYLGTASTAAPCQTGGSPVLDAGFGVQCTAAASECHAAVATFGSIDDFLSPSVGCSTGLWPPYDCVQDCDGPPTSQSVAICSTQLDASDHVVGDDPIVRSHCTTENIDGLPDCYADTQVGYDGSVRLPIPRCPIVQCVTDPCPLSSAAPSLPCDPTVDAGTLSLTAICTSGTCEVGPVIEDGRYDHVLVCGPFIYCVTEPCPGSGRIEV